MDEQNAYAALKDAMARMGRVLVAFSGGVDSALLLKAAVDALGDRALAVTAVSETTPRHEAKMAAHLARRFGAAHRIIHTRELDDPDFTRNPPERCYICKRYRFGMLVAMARREGYAVVADGGNADDHKDYRPGIRAARELGVVSPLSDLGLTKQRVRAASRMLGLPGWDRPAIACLASRIPYHSPIAAEKLQRVDAAEDFLRERGLSPGLRVRHLTEEAAAIEPAPGDAARLLENDLREAVIAFFKQLGFARVTLDLEGYRMGSLNSAIPTE